MYTVSSAFLKQKGGGTSAEGASIEAPRVWGVGRNLRRELCPSAEFILIFGAQNH